MTNNDCLRRLRYVFDFNDTKMISIFSLADLKVTREQVSKLLKKDEDPDYEECSDSMLAIFLNGLINDKRGKRDGEQPKAETRINNNMILKKIKIALNLKAEDMLTILEQVGVYISKHELSAFFRKSDHKHYRKCKDQILRNFLMGLQLQHRGENVYEDEVQEEFEEGEEVEVEAQEGKYENQVKEPFKWKQ